MLIKINVVRKASGKFEVDGQAGYIQQYDYFHRVKIGGQFAEDILGLLKAAIAAHNRTVDEGQ